MIVFGSPEPCRHILQHTTKGHIMVMVPIPLHLEPIEVHTQKIQAGQTNQYKNAFRTTKTRICSHISFHYDKAISLDVALIRASAQQWCVLLLH